MNKASNFSTPRLVISGVTIAVPLVLALVGCAGSHPPTAPKAGTANPTAVGNQPQAITPTVAIPKYVASENARKEVILSSCQKAGKKGWRIQGTAMNLSSSARNYSIVVDFVTKKGDTVLDTKVVRVPVAPRKSRHWSTIGAPGQAEVTCVIRQALARA